MRVHVNLDEMKKFRLQLIETRKSLISDRKIFNQKIEDISKVWDGPDYQEFKNRCKEIDTELAIFQKELEKRIEYLVRKEAAGRDVLRNW